MLTRKFGARERALLLAGAVLLGLGLAGLGRANAWETVAADVLAGGLLALVMVTVAVLGIGFALLNPSIITLLSRRSDPTQQGEILGVNRSASALAQVVGLVSASALYRLPPAHLLPFVLGTAFMLLVLGLSVRALGDGVPGS